MPGATSWPRSPRGSRPRRWRRRSPGPTAGWSAATAPCACERLAEETGWSRRHLSQRFREEIGLTPKAFGRLLRFQRAIELLREGEPLADAAFAAGYADQPHMNRDFRAFYGAPPGELPFVQDGALAA